jgi:hypothetical protein
MNHGRQDDPASEVGRRENTDRRLVIAGDQGTTDVEGKLQVEFLADSALGVSQQKIFHLAQDAIAGGRQITREQVAEREVVHARLEAKVLREEVPTGQLLRASSTAGAVAGHGLLSGVLRDEAHVELAEDDFAGALRDGHTQTTREQSTSRVAWVAIADQWRRLDQDLKLGGRLSQLLLAEALLRAAGASQAAALVLAVVSVGVNQVVHVER